MSHAVMVRPIRTEEDFEIAVARVERIMYAEEGTPEFDEAQVLCSLITTYERRVRAVPASTPIDAVRFAMDDRGLKESDLSIYFSSQSRVSEFLAGKRELAVEQIRKLHEGLGIPLEVLVGRSDPRWTVPDNRRQCIFEVVERRNLSSDEVLIELRRHYDGVRVHHAIRSSQQPDFEAIRDNDLLYMPPDGNERFYPCEIVDGRPKVIGYSRKPRLAQGQESHSDPISR